MAIFLLNENLALDSIQSFSNNDKVLTGIIRMKDEAITAVTVNQRIAYQRDKGTVVTYNGKEYVLVKFADLEGRITA